MLGARAMCVFQLDAVPGIEGSVAESYERSRDAMSPSTTRATRSAAAATALAACR